MAKNKNNSNVNGNSNSAADAADEAPEVVVTDAQTGEVVEGSTESAVAVTAEADAPVEVFADDATLREWARTLPKKYEVVLDGLSAVTPEELDAVVAKLPKAKQEKFTAMRNRNARRKMGDFSPHREIRPKDLKIHQTGDDPSRPIKAVPGSIYGTDEVLHTAPTAENVRVANHPDENGNQPSPLVALSTRMAVLTRSHVRSFRKPQENSRTVLPDGVEAGESFVICESMDGLIGSKYGDCSVCPYAPSKKKQEGANTSGPTVQFCRNEWIYYLIPEDCSTVYRLSVHGTSAASFTFPMEKKFENWDTFSDYWLDLSTESKTGKGPNQRYFVLKGTVGPKTSPQEREFFAVLARQLTRTILIPSLVSVYTRFKAQQAQALTAAKDGEAAPEATTPQSAMKKLLANAAAKAST